jgi:DNA-binding NtrC family response regulator
MSCLRVLFVDDEEELVSAVVERLGLRGIEVQGALTGEEALQLIEQRDFDVVVLDVKMPGLGGLEVIKRIKQDHPGLAVVFLTGHGAEEDAEAGLRMGAFQYLMKPIDIEALVQILRKAANG